MPNFTLLCLSCSPLSKKWPKHGPIMAKIWSTHGPSNWFFLNLNQCSGIVHAKFTILGVSHSPLFLKMAKIWLFYGQNMVLTWSFKLVLPESLFPGMLHANIQSPSINVDRYFQLCGCLTEDGGGMDSKCWVYPVAALS